MRKIYTVERVNRYIHNKIAQDPFLIDIFVEGEASNVKYHSSGHIYFSLKDASGALACVMFAGNRAGLPFQMQNGQNVVVRGYIGTYERGGTYQLYAREIRPKGTGDLHEKFEALKKKLGEMGMFDPMYKKSIPAYATQIGVVTAKTGAAIWDIRNVSERRNPFVQVILAPAKVQGEGAAESVASAIERLDALGLDVIIIGRGGGSMEDLWAFNEEIVARAIFDSVTPVISAVGHETDFTISDMVADLRAPTPSAAAEIAVFSYQEFAGGLDETRVRFRSLMRKKADACRLLAGQKEARLKTFDPERHLDAGRERLARSEEKLGLYMQNALYRNRQNVILKRERLKRNSPEQKLEKVCKSLEGNREKLSFLMDQAFSKSQQDFLVRAERLDGLSPLKRLSGGYTFAEKDGVPVRKLDDITPGEEVKIYVTDGSFDAKVLRKEEEKIDRREKSGTCS